jgi:ribose transport system ATP-binding protein
MVAPAFPLIEIDGITQRFPGVVALAEVSFDVREGELHAICGENGAGKSTLMKILSGVYTEPEGTLRLRGREVVFRGTADAERAGIAIIHQELNLVEDLSVAANMYLGRELRTRFGWLDDREMSRRAAEKLAELECDASPAALVKSLRIGDQQLVEIGKALLLDAEVLIMDEPTSALTESEVARLYRVIAALRARGKTILYISHKMDEVFTLADRITVLRDGRHVKTLDRTATSPREITTLMVGRDIDRGGAAPRPQPGEPVLEVRNLSLPWPGHARGYRLKNVSFTLRRGEVLGIAGLMGAGRTELLECLFGAPAEPITGEILLDGRPRRFEHPAEAVAAGIALVTEDRKRTGLFTRMDTGENITLCRLRELRHNGLISARRQQETARGVVTKLGVRAAGITAAITGLSGGNQQKCILGRWLLTQPKVLLLDDPTRGVDVGAKAELHALILELCATGLSVIVTSSELPELLTLSDRILVLREGVPTAELTRAEATEERIMRAATTGAE